MNDKVFDEYINRKGTYCTQWDYIKDRFGESDLLPFTISDMDFKVPSPISQKLEKRISHEVYGYTRWNHAEYKESIINWFDKQFDCQILPEWIVYSPSVIYSVSQLIEINSNVDDHVVIQTPAYDAFFKTIKSNHRKTIENHLIYENGHYLIDFEDLEEKLSHEKAKVFLLCSPHNPTGRVWNEEELVKMLDLCEKYDVFLISDEIHMDIVREDFKHHPIFSFAKNFKNIALCSSTSKTFNTAGLIGSYMMIPNEETRNEFLYILKNKDGLSSASIMGIESTMTAYNECQEWVEGLNTYLTKNLSIVSQYLKENIPEIKFTIPESTFLAWLDTSDLPFSMEEIQQALIKVGKVAIMDGAIYGEPGKNFLRMNIGCPKEKVEDGLDRLNKSIQYLRENQ